MKKDDLMHRSRVRGAVAAIAFCTAAGGVAAVASDEVDGTRAAIERWVETRRIISQEERDWEVGREMLEERIAIVEREIEGIRAKMKESEASITDVDRRKAELAAESDGLKAVSARMTDVVVSLEERTKALLARLPDPIRDRVRSLSQQLPEKPSESTLALTTRFMNVIGTLNMINKFSRELTVTSELRALPDGSSVEVTALYLGISKAFYVSANRAAAGVGSSGATGWTWTPKNDAAQQIADAIAVLQGDQVARFVHLPVVIEDGK